MTSPTAVPPDHDRHAAGAAWGPRRGRLVLPVRGGGLAGRRRHRSRRPALRHSGAAVVRREVLAALETCRDPRGIYRFRNDHRFVIARRPGPGRAGPAGVVE